MFIVGVATTKKKVRRMCTYCYQVIYQGCRHRCTALQRARNLIGQCTELDKERITNMVLKQKLEEGGDVNDSTRDYEGKTVKLRSFGRPSFFTVLRGKARYRRKITYDLIRRAKIAANLSNRQTNKVLAHIRHGVGRRFIVKNVGKQLVADNKIFDEDFVSENVEMEVSKADLRGSSQSKKNTMILKPMPLVYPKDLSSFVSHLLTLRGNLNINGMWIKIFVDDGRGILKVSLAMVPKVLDENQSEKEGSKKPKFLEEFKLTGVKRLMLIGGAPVKETGKNLKVLFEKIGLLYWDADIHVVADMCCVNQLMGLGNHKSLFPCHICHWRSGKMASFDRGATKRTFGTLKGNLSI